MRKVHIYSMWTFQRMPFDAEFPHPFKDFFWECNMKSPPQLQMANIWMISYKNRIDDFCYDHTMRWSHYAATLYEIEIIMFSEFWSEVQYPQCLALQDNRIPFYSRCLMRRLFGWAGGRDKHDDTCFCMTQLTMFWLHGIGRYIFLVIDI